VQRRGLKLRHLLLTNYMRGRLFILALVCAGAVLATGRDARAQRAASRQGGGEEVRPIADAITHRSTDREVTIAGRALVSAGKLQSSVFDVAIEDGTAGLRIFSRNAKPDVKEGDSVRATGTIKSYRGNLELVATKLAVVNAPRRLPQPHELPIEPPVIAQYSGQLVRVHGRVAGFGHSEGGQWLRLRDAASTAHGMLTVWVPANHGAPIDLGRVKTEDSLIVTGVVTSFQDNVEDPVVWQLVPRDNADIQISVAPTGLPTWLLWIALATAVAAGAMLVMGRVGAQRQLRTLRETEARYRQLLALLPDAVIVHARGTIIFTNPAAAELLGVQSEQTLIGRTLAEFVHPDSKTIFAEEVPQQAGPDAGRAVRSRARMLDASGSSVEVEVASSPCVYHDRPAMVLLARDITAQLRHEHDLHALALVDELTGLQNRRAFTLFAEQELARARRNGRTPVLVFADLDGLKRINDEHGHAAGDAAIRLVAHALTSILRETDIVARWSGDEFVALMGEGSDEAALLIGARLDAAIALHSPPRLPYVVTASVGASPLDPALPLRDAMERADADLYAQKKRGRRSKRVTPVGIDAMRLEE
jgi:diguanylate cyclase (GGDEF)-like protein/PAS domain S-box-containing protein